MNKPLFSVSILHGVVKTATFVFGVLLFVTSATLLFSQPSSALSGKDFKAGNIIDDYTFYHSGSMSASEIQTFLNAKVPSCDTQGKLSASAFGYPNKTRAQYAAMKGWQSPPYTCLRNYKQNTPQMEAASGLCEAIASKTNRTGAQIIKDVADACGVNPQVLLVLLEKEQSLITDTWPLNSQYKKATGFACPDTAPCDSSYGSFFYQVYYAARQFKTYKAYPDNYNYIAGENNRIYYNPRSSCGSSTVYIENQATAGLYNYTPYQPNKSALNNLYGSGDSCGAYGNRNFWRLFSDWFGSTHGGITVSSISFESQPFTNKQTNAIITIKNISRTTVNLGRIKIEARGEADTYYQTSSVSNLSIKAGATYTFKQPITIAEEGTLTFAVARNVDNAWQTPPFSDYALTSTTQKSVQVTKEPTVDQSLTLSSGIQHVDAPVTATFRIKNNSTTEDINVGRLKVEGSLNGTQYDFSSTASNLTIPAGQTYTYSQQFTPTKIGVYTFKIMSYRTDYGWSNSFPASSAASVSRSASITVRDSVTMTSPLSLSKTSGHQGETITANFTLKNFSTKAINIGRTKIEGTLGKDKYDFPSTPENLTLQPGQEYTYSKSRTFTKNGTYSLRVMNIRDGFGWSSTYPNNQTKSITRTENLSIKDPVTVTQSLQMSTTSTRAGNSVTATFKLKNFSDKAVSIGRMKVEGKMSKTQFDFPSTPENLTLQPGQEYTYSKSRELPAVGKYTFTIVNYRPATGWSNSFPINETRSIARTATVSVFSAVTVTTGLSLSPTTGSTSTAVIATFTLRNFSDKAVNVGRMKVEAKVGTSQYDFSSSINNLVLQPGEVYTYNKSRTLPKTGTYTLRIVNYRSSTGWSATYPAVESSAIARSKTLVIH